MKTAKKAKKTVMTKIATKVKKDQYGFREGTNVSKLFAALLKGATMEELKKIAGTVASKTMSEFKKSPKENPRGLSAKIEVSDKGIYKIKSHS